MSELWQSPYLFGAYLLAILLLRRYAFRGRSFLEAVLNVFATFFFFFSEGNYKYFGPILLVSALIYLGQCAFFRIRAPLLAIFLPILVLIAWKLAPQYSLAHYSIWFGQASLPYLVQSGLLVPSAWIGFSYLCFRWSLLATETSVNQKKFPNLAEFFAYSFFVPIFVIGPITSFTTFQDSMSGKYKLGFEILPSILERLAVGLVKTLFIAPLFYQYTFSGLGQEMEQLGQFGVGEFTFHLLCYFVYIYCNFSGICDLIIGLSAMTQTKVDENFNAPHLARNLKDLWARWHMTLTHYVQALIYNPMSKSIVRYLPRATHGLLLQGAVALTFVVIGLWHGFEHRYVMFGLMNALGISTCAAWGQVLRRLPTRIRKWYFDSYLVLITARTITLIFFAFSLFYFENSETSIDKIKSMTTFLGWIP